MEEKKIIETLNDLLTKNYDAEFGYNEASDHVEDEDLQRFFKVMSAQRKDFGKSLKIQIQTLGGDIEKGVSLKSVGHRVWMDLKVPLSSNSREAVIEECIRGEKASLEEYSKAFQEIEYPIHVHRLLGNQMAKIEEAIFSLKELLEKEQVNEA